MMRPETHSALDPGRQLRFDEFRFDRESHELWRSGAPVPLAPKPGRILAALLARPGALVTREKLYAAGWEDTVVALDLSLNTAIRQIRQALGDDAGRPRFVQTVPRRGYRFIAPVTRLETRPAGERFSPAAGPIRRVRPRVASLAALALATLFLALLSTGSDPPPTVAIAAPLILDDTVDPATGRLIEESIRSTAARSGTGMRVLDATARESPVPVTTAYVVRSFLLAPEPGSVRLEVRLVRTSDHAILWSGAFDPFCDQIADPTASIANYVAQVLAKRAI